MRIVHYSPGMRLQLGGVVRAVLDWCGVLAARGHEVVLVAYDAPDLPGDWNGSAGKPRFVRIPAAERPNGLVASKAVRMWEEALAGGGVAHLHCPWTASNMQMARSARRAAIPYVVSIHGMLDDWPMGRGAWKKRLFLALGGRRYLRLADRLHYTAEAEREQAGKWVPGGRAAVLPCLVDLAPFQQLPGADLARLKSSIGGDAPVLLFLSRVDEQKGVHLLIEAARLLRDRGQKFQLIIAGPADDRAYQARLIDDVQRHGVREMVRFTGLVSGAEKISLYQAADLFVLPTQHENMGLVLIEAMAAGAAVLTTRGTDFWPDIAAAGGTICDKAPQALCEAIGRLLHDRPALIESGRRGRAWVMERFAADRLAGEYEALYRQVIQEHHRAAAV